MVFFSFSGSGSSGTSSLSTRSMTLYLGSSSSMSESKTMGSSTGSGLVVVRRRRGVRCAAAVREEGTIGLSDEEVDDRVTRRLVFLVNVEGARAGAGLSEGLEEVRSFVARRLRVCRGGGMSLLSLLAGIVASSGEEVDARDVVDWLEKL